MIVKKSNEVRAAIQKLVDEHAIDTAVQLSITLPLQQGDVFFNDISSLDHDAFVLQKHMKDYGFNYSNKQALMGVMISDLLKQSPLGTMVSYEIFNALITESKMFAKEELSENPYLQNISFEKNKKVGNYVLEKAHLKRFSLFFYDIPQIEVNGARIPRIGSVEHRYDYPLIGAENSDVWMSITPNEIYTMKKSIDESFGNVLTLGCGMGYYAYMTSEKESVKDVTIIEKSPEIIELFESYILPQFQHKEKIKLVQADAFDYMEELDDGIYDYCFADIWKNNLDSLSYMKLKRICKKFQKTKMSYWIEKAILHGLRSYVEGVLLQSMSEGFEKPFDFNIDEEQEKARRYISDIYKDEVIANPADIDNLLKFENIIKKIIA